MQISNVPMTAQNDAVAAAITNKSSTQENATAQTSGSTNSPSSSGGTPEATVTANDFLTLLVTEMKNQDPTANTDPNQYINQLVEVNSLQQLISINQEVGTLGSTAAASGTSASGATAQAASGVSSSGQKASTQTAASSAVKAEALQQTAGQVASAGLDASPLQSMRNFATALGGQPGASSSQEATMAASAARVASALGPGS